ncbi:hypothetical protein ADL26_16705, partial [Thermoactinomyces vulgaris]
PNTVLTCPAALLAPRRRAGEDRVRQVPDRFHGGAGDAAEDRGERGRDGHVAVAEEHGAVGDALLGVRFEPFGRGEREPLGVASGVDDPAGVEEHGRGHDRGAVEQQRPGAAVGPHQHRHGVV